MTISSTAMLVDASKLNNFNYPVETEYVMYPGYHFFCFIWLSPPLLKAFSKYPHLGPSSPTHTSKWGKTLINALHYCYCDWCKSNYHTLFSPRHKTVLFLLTLLYNPAAIRLIIYCYSYKLIMHAAITVQRYSLFMTLDMKLYFCYCCIMKKCNNKDNLCISVLWFTEPCMQLFFYC